MGDGEGDTVSLRSTGIVRRLLKPSSFRLSLEKYIYFRKPLTIALEDIRRNPISDTATASSSCDRDGSWLLNRRRSLSSVPDITPITYFG